MTPTFTSTRNRAGMITIVLASLLWLNVLSAVVVINPAFHQGTPSGLTGDKILICTVHGLQWVSATDWVNQQDGSPHTQWQNHCPLLTPLQPIHYDTSHIVPIMLASVAIFSGLRRMFWLSANNKLYELFGPKHSPPTFSTSSHFV
ncbi:hypothetical protein [Photobacterium sp. TLY01]|uniref:hypothetical protein n=1 Tax=Photobacterium sp. TLY01 TaxID=2907534 RepID=UPI001F19FEF0|nr:hypothetical protein [Photobacterium sp. TLY01]UIP30656.1 hypothetical protein LN341_18305 [Photobacterium sp. TLY01]